MRPTAYLCLLLAALLAACIGRDSSAPPRSDSQPHFEARTSSVVVPVDISLDGLQAELERQTPRRLWSIDQQNSKCVPGQRVKVLGRRLKVTPDIDCRIVGEVTRGRIRLTGRGNRLQVTMPIRAVVSARDVGGILKGETATASATVAADVRLGVDRDWKPIATVQISYDWREPPGIDFLGQRIRFASRADRELAGVIDKLERDLQRQVARVQLKPLVAQAWEHGFTVIELSKRNPPAWMRITPQAMGLQGYSVNGRRLTLTVAVEALAETFVGDRPPDPDPKPLPPQLEGRANTGLSFFMPVMADYAELEPVVLKALRKLAAKGIEIEGVGHVNARFDKVIIYATGPDRIAVGIDAQVEPVGQRTGISLGKTKGRVWLTGKPISEAGSQVVRVSGVQVYGDTDSISGDLLLRVAASDSVRGWIAQSLMEDFTNDYDKVLDKARRAVADKQLGPLRLSAQIDRVDHGVIQVTGAGLFMPVVASGRGEIRVRRQP